MSIIKTQRDESKITLGDTLAYDRYVVTGVLGMDIHGVVLLVEDSKLNNEEYNFYFNQLTTKAAFLNVVVVRCGK